jgi:plasmid maintenance system killer protein
MKFKKYIIEQKLNTTQVKQVKKEIAELKASMNKGKLKTAGKKRLEKLEDMLFDMGIFDF